MLLLPKNYNKGFNGSWNAEFGILNLEVGVWKKL